MSGTWLWDDAWCSVNTPDRSCRVFSDGYTAIQDIAFNTFNRLYVYELAAEGVLAFEAGFETASSHRPCCSR